jgi:aprataxin
LLIDRCNFDVQQRSHWLQLGRIPRDVSELGATVRHVAVFLDVDPGLALERVLGRSQHEGRVDSESKTHPELRTIVRRFSSMIEPPDEREGFDRVLVCSSEEDSRVVARALRAAVESADAGLGLGLGSGWEGELERAAEGATVAAGISLGVDAGATQGDPCGHVATKD